MSNYTSQPNEHNTWQLDHTRSHLANIQLVTIAILEQLIPNQSPFQITVDFRV